MPVFPFKASPFCEASLEGGAPHLLLQLADLNLQFPHQSPLPCPSYLPMLTSYLQLQPSPLTCPSTAVSDGLGWKKCFKDPTYAIFFKDVKYSYVSIPFNSAQAHSTRPHNEKKLFTLSLQPKFLKIRFTKVTAATCETCANMRIHVPPPALTHRKRGNPTPMGGGPPRMVERVQFPSLSTMTPIPLLMFVWIK